MKQDRGNSILSLLEAHHQLSSEKLAELLHVSVATVRRDTDALAEEGRLERFHGGVRQASVIPNQQLPMFLRRQINLPQKQLLARKAAEFIAPGSTLFIAGGSTVAFLGLFLKRCKIFTNSVDLCALLNERRSESGEIPDLVMTGGRLHHKHGILLGAGARASVERYHCDWAICSVYGVDERGLMEIDEEPLDIQERMFRNSSRRMVIADESKFSRRAGCLGMAWNEIDLLICVESPSNRAMLRKIREAGCQVESAAFPSCG